MDRAGRGSVHESFLSFLALFAFLRLFGMSWCRTAGMFPIVAGHSLCNLLIGELAVVFRVQNFGLRTRIVIHCYYQLLTGRTCRRSSAF